MDSFSVYLIYSPSCNKIYIGFTSREVDMRLYAHNHIEKGSFTSKYRPWSLVHYEIFETKKEAMHREKQLKSAKGRESCWLMVNEKYPNNL